ncbi:hypothetical protein [Paenibacillus sp. WLX2291]|uniref:hypothetical protein n=1 Tax=Paenibacillus sp. WLX2291 TaxID=3296934 RepID=UPI00398412A0
MATCSNIDIAETAKIADLLLEVGAAKTPNTKDDIKYIGTHFEFHRERFNKEYIQETDEGLAHLYKLFELVPIQQRKIHDSVSQILISTHGWQAQRDELWNVLISSSGSASTVQAK